MIDLIHVLQWLGGICISLLSVLYFNLVNRLHAVSARLRLLETSHEAYKTHVAETYAQESKMEKRFEKLEQQIEIVQSQTNIIGADVKHILRVIEKKF